MTRIPNQTRDSHLRSSGSLRRFHRLLVIPEWQDGFRETAPDDHEVSDPLAAGQEHEDPLPTVGDAVEIREDQPVQPESHATEPFRNERSSLGRYVPRPSGTRTWLRTWAQPVAGHWRRALVLFVGVVGVTYGWSKFGNSHTHDGEQTSSSARSPLTEDAGEIHRMTQAPLRVNRSAIEATSSETPAVGKPDSIFRTPSLTTHPVQRVMPQQNERAGEGQQSPADGPPGFNAPDGSRVTRRDSPRGTPTSDVTSPAIPQRQLAGRATPETGVHTAARYGDAHTRPSSHYGTEQSAPAPTYPTTDPRAYRVPPFTIPNVADRPGTTTR